MPKKTSKPISLDRNDIILGADAETIRAALEAREQIDVLLNERAEAYRKIAELEGQVDDLLGDDAQFPFPEPELPVASFGNKPKTAAKKRVAPKPAPDSKAEAEEGEKTAQAPKPDETQSENSGKS